MTDAELLSRLIPAEPTVETAEAIEDRVVRATHRRDRAATRLERAQAEMAAADAAFVHACAGLATWIAEHPDDQLEMFERT